LTEFRNCEQITDGVKGLVLNKIARRSLYLPPRREYRGGQTMPPNEDQLSVMLKSPEIKESL
jgi:hypothetical protein